MERKYFYARTVGTPESTLYRITTAVVDAALASQIPLVKLERRARGEFYVFLGVDSDESTGIPGGLGKTLQNLGLRFEEDFPLRPDEIQSMVQRQDIEIHGLNALQYRQMEYEDPGDPFDQSDAWQPQEASPASSALVERLLHWLSVRGEGTWEGFNQACNVLKVAEDKHEVRSILRRLILLGHLDLSDDGSRWSVSPAVLVRFPDNPDNGFLAGQRTESFLRMLGEFWHINETLQSYYPGPPRVDLTSGVAENIADLGVTDAGPTSTRLASLLPDLNEWKDSLQSLDNLRVSSYEIERWQYGSFQPCNNVYDLDGTYYGEPGMYRVSLERDRSGRTLTLFFDEPAQRWVRGDWYGLRFLSLKSGQTCVEAIHDSGTGELLIPASQRWPLLYERALTLASGMLPRRAANPDWLSYPRIPLDLAKVLCRKLKVNLMEN